MTRVAVTTTADVAPRLADALVGYGLVPIMLPCIAISPAPPAELAELRSQASKADLIVVASARAVRITWPNGDMPAVPVAAVGPSSAAAVEAAGGIVETIGEGGSSDLVAGLDVDGRFVVFPHARASDPSTTSGLEGRGAKVYAAAAYDTIPIAPNDDKVDAAIFGSPSAIEGWLMRRPLDGMVIGAIGATTASALRVRGVEHPVVPVRPRFEELAEALAERINA